MTRWLTAEQVAAYQAKRANAPKRGELTSVRLTLPFPPTLNHSTMPTAGGGRYLTDDHKLFRAQVAEIARRAGSPTIQGRLAVCIDVMPPNRRKFDLDNRIKGTLDSLQKAGVFADDEAIDDLRIRRLPGFIAGEGGATVVITRILGAAA